MIKKLFILLFLSIPAFALMLRPGIFTMHDFHVFRQLEFTRCFSQGFFPCRWAADSTLGYGQPLFNFYGQFPYWLGQIFVALSFSIIDSVKIVFILSLVASGIAMYILGKSLWGTTGGLISGIFYMYAPYRSVDIWVRGALPESLAFIFFPLLLLLSYRYIFTHRQSHLLLFSLCLSGLIITHNLSVFMFLPFLVLWCLYWLVLSRNWSAVIGLAATCVLSGLLSAFYLLPVLFETSLTSVSSTTAGYFQYGEHFTTLYRLFISNYWGYGGSLWGPVQYMSFSVGYAHWLLPALLVVAGLFLTNIRPLYFHFLFFVILGALALFLTHGKSNFIWQAITPLSFVQFPWRFLTMSTLFFSLSAGFLTQITKVNAKFLSGLALTSVLLLNTQYFRPDIWKSVTDDQYFKGPSWDEQRSSAISDFWPKGSLLPTSSAPIDPAVLTGKASVSLPVHSGQLASYRFAVQTPQAEVQLPIVSFPGWQASLDGRPQLLYVTGPIRLLTTTLPAGNHTLSLRFSDTAIRSVGNMLSLVSLCLTVLVLFLAILFHV